MRIFLLALCCLAPAAAQRIDLAHDWTVQSSKSGEPEYRTSVPSTVVAAMVAKNHRAEVRTLLMMADGSMGECDYEFSEVADEMFNLSLEPEKLVEKVRSMLDGRLQSSPRISPWEGQSRLAPTN